MSIRRSSLICVAYLQVYERVADNRWWPNIGGLLYCDTLIMNNNIFNILARKVVTEFILFIAALSSKPAAAAF